MMIDIYHNRGGYYGSIQIKLSRAPLVEEDLMEEIENRLPFLKGKQYKIEV